MAKFVSFGQLCVVIYLSFHMGNQLKTASSMPTTAKSMLTSSGEVTSGEELPSGGKLTPSKKLTLGVKFRLGITNGKSARSKGKRFSEFTKRLSRDLTPVARELLQHLKGKTISLVVEDKPIYKKAAESMKHEFKEDIVSITYVTNSNFYSVEENFSSIRETIKEATNKSRVVLLLVDARIAKECLIAAHDLKLTSGDHVFVVFELNVLSAAARQANPFKWATADYYYMGTFKQFLERSAKLCWAFQSTLVVMTKLPAPAVKLINKRIVNFYQLHKAGHFKSTSTSLKEREFASIGYELFVDEKGENRYPLSLYHYGSKGAGSRCAAIINNEYLSTVGQGSTRKQHYPKMVAIGDFTLVKARNCPSCTNEWKMSFNRVEKSQLYWPGNESIYKIGDKPPCDPERSGENCANGVDNVIVFQILCVAIVTVMLIIVFVAMYRKCAKVKDAKPSALETSMPISKTFSEYNLLRISRFSSCDI